MLFFTNLTNGLVAFFGAALGCSDNTIPSYTGPDMRTIHHDLGIKQYVFDTFNNILLGVLQKAGVSAADLKAVLGVLNAQSNDIVVAYVYDDFEPNYVTGGTVAGAIIGGLILAVILGALIFGLVMIEKNLPKFK